MGSESTEVQMARIDEQLKVIVRELSDAKMGRKEQYSEIEKVNLNMVDISSRLKIVEDSMTKNAPTIEEFITIKHKVVGAGMAGKWLWAIGGILLGLVAAIKTNIVDFIK